MQEVFDTDQGGHVFGFRFVLAQGLRNMFAQDGHFNMTPYRVMENEWADFARYGARVEVEIELLSQTLGNRPHAVKVEGVAFTAKSNRILENVDFRRSFKNNSSQNYSRRYYRRDIRQLVADSEGDK